MTKKHSTKSHSFSHKKLSGSDKEKKADHKEKKHSHKKKNGKEDIEDQLAHIYQNADGSMPDMQHFQSKERGRWLRALATLLVVCSILAAIAWAGFFIIAPSAAFSEDNVIVSVSGNDGITIGENTRYRIRYRNAQQVSLSQVRIDVRYPKGFVYEKASVEPDGEDHASWTLGSVGPNDSGYIDVFGTMFGDIGDGQSVRVFFNYIPANFSSEFQKVATISIDSSDAPLGISVEGISETVAGIENEFDIVVSFKDESPANMPAKLALEIGEGAGFLKKGSSVEPDQFHDHRWSIESLDSPFTLKVKGVFLSQEDSQEVTLPIRVIGWSTPEAREDESFLYAETETVVTLLEESLQLTPIINGSRGELDVIPGEPMQTSIVIKNRGENTLNNVRVRAAFDSPSFERESLLHWTELDDPADGHIRGEQINDAVRRGVITWDSSNFPGLKSLSPAEEVVIDFRLPVKGADDTTLANFISNTVELLVDMQYESGGEQEIFASESFVITIQSDTALELRDEVSEDKKDHKITWIISNTFHDLKDVTLEADVYGATSVKDGVQVSAGSGRFDGENKKIIWELQELPTVIDVATMNVTLRRDHIDPSQTQLTSKIRLRGTDAVTGEDIILVGDEIGL